jgi:hypothetical protein
MSGTSLLPRQPGFKKVSVVTLKEMAAVPWNRSMLEKKAISEQKKPDRRCPMATDPNGIHLTQEDKLVLATLVDGSGKELSEALREAVATYLERSAPAAKPNGIQACDTEREQAFLRAAGAWADMDTDTLLEEIYTQRSRAT